MLKDWWEILTFFSKRKKYILLPILVVLILLGLLMVAVTTGILAPVLYPIF